MKKIKDLFRNSRRNTEKENEKAENVNAQNVNANAQDDKSKGNDSQKARIHNLIIVDESGSMGCLRDATLGGINETINTIKSAQEKYKDTQTHTLTLVTFDSGEKKETVRTIIDDKPITEVEEFTDYNPWGCTPLYDAVGKSVTSLYEKIRDDEDATGVVTILTDGMENSSTEWTLEGVSKLIEQLKEEGWTFSYMGSTHDVKSVTMQLKIENVIEFKHDVVGSANTWERERASRNSYYDKMEQMYRENWNASREEKMRMKRQYAQEYYSNRVTPHYVDHLEPNEIFVFGSNNMGRHSGGAAALAVDRFGARIGQGEGLQGQSYAIPTTDGISLFFEAVERFTNFAYEHPELRFLVTRVGCGSAGYSINEVAQMFTGCIKLENVALPAEFWEVLGLRM